MHTFTVALRIFGQSLDPAKVALDYKMTPSQTRLTGERRSANSAWDESMWEWEARPHDGDGWSSLEQGLIALLGAFKS